MKKKDISKSNAKVFIISAPSGTGKTTLCRKLLKIDKSLAGSVSVTTRLPRPGEKNGIDYHFVTKKQFVKMAGKGAFLEYEENFGNLYGTPKKFIFDNLSKGKSVLINIDVKGAMKIRKVLKRLAVLIFLMPPSLKILEKRLHGRHSDSPEQVKKRLALARKEISFKDRYDHLVVNDRIGKACRDLRGIILNISKGSERCT